VHVDLTDAGWVVVAQVGASYKGCSFVGLLLSAAKSRCRWSASASATPVGWPSLLAPKVPTLAVEKGSDALKDITRQAVAGLLIFSINAFSLS
jgi:hypothetical protein